MSLALEDLVVVGHLVVFAVGVNLTHLKKTIMLTVVVFKVPFKGNFENNKREKKKRTRSRTCC